jgi:hypothetical protein
VKTRIKASRQIASPRDQDFLGDGVGAKRSGEYRYFVRHRNVMYVLTVACR